jgi:uncharacterized protein (UPF0548 family)
VAPLTYDEVGATRPAAEDWDPPAGWRHHEQTVLVGRGEDVWDRAAANLMSWGVKTRSGFSVVPAEVLLGAEPELVARIGPLRIREPVRVVAVVDQPDRRGFAYGTLPGHPVSGEEAFVLHRDSDGRVWFTLRSITRPAPGRWRLVFPVLLLAQRVYRRRYRRAVAL